MRDGNQILVPQIYSDAVIGAGGWMTGCDEPADDGTVLGRCDTAPAYILPPGGNKWIRQMIPGVDMNPADVNVSSGFNINIYGETIGKIDSSVRYLATLGTVWVKKPGATNYTPTSLPKRGTIDGNSTYRMCGHPLESDPDNPAVCIFMAPEGGFITTDYGDNWTPIDTAELPVPIGGHAIIRFDRSRGLVGGRRQFVYAFIPGYGTYLSADGGTTWDKLPAMPGSDTAASHLKVRRTDGLVVVSGMNTEGDSFIRVYNRNTNSWVLGIRTDANAPQNCKTVAFSGTAGRMYGFTAGGAITYSSDDGANWSDYGGPDLKAADMDIPWHIEDTGYKSVGEVVKLPGSETFLMTSGIGAWLIPNPPTSFPGYGTKVRFVGKSLGIENMVGTNINYAPDGSMGMTMQDKQTILFGAGKAGRELPRHFGPVHAIYRGVNTDYALGNTKFWATSIVGLGIGYTQDGGKTWAVNESLRNQSGNEGGGGQLCVLTEDIVLCAQNAPGTRAQSALYITRNFRATTPVWTEVPIGSGDGVVGHYAFFNGAPRKVLVKDPLEPGTVYFYNCSEVDFPNKASSISDRGVWMIKVNLGANVAPVVTRQYDQRLMGLNQDAIHNKLVLLGKVGDMAFAGGDNAPWLYRSRNKGVTWTEFGGTDSQGAGDRFMEVFGVSAGKARWDSQFPTLYVAGYRGFGPFDANGTTDFAKYGLWASYNDGEYWERLEQFPGGHVLHPQDIGASPTTFGEVTIALPGMGAITRYYDTELDLT